MKNNNLLVVLLGPTGVGKTDLSIQLAKHLQCSIISADSRQLYQQMQIGTAAPTQSQLLSVPHYFIHSIPPDKYYNAAQYEEEVIQLLENNIFTKQNRAILTGGSMMYIDAVCKGIDKIPSIDPQLRTQIKKDVENFGLDHIRQQLKLLDPEFYHQVDLKNTQRVIHALEVCLMSGKPYSSLRLQTNKERPFKILKIGLTRNREELYERINLRVDHMINEGLIDECIKLSPWRQYNALNTVGYKEIYQYIDGECTLDFAIQKIKQHSRIYARKQLTWFKRDDSIHWFNLSESETPNIKEQIIRLINSNITLQ